MSVLSGSISCEKSALPDISFGELLSQTCVRIIQISFLARCACLYNKQGRLLILDDPAGQRHVAITDVKVTLSPRSLSCAIVWLGIFWGSSRTKNNAAAQLGQVGPEFIREGSQRTRPTCLARARPRDLAKHARTPRALAEPSGWNQGRQERECSRSQALGIRTSWGRSGLTVTAQARLLMATFARGSLCVGKIRRVGSLGASLCGLTQRRYSDALPRPQAAWSFEKCFVERRKGDAFSSALRGEPDWWVGNLEHRHKPSVGRLIHICVSGELWGFQLNGRSQVNGRKLP